MAKKRAKTLSDEQFERLVTFQSGRSRFWARDALMLSLSFYAGLRA